MSADILKLRDLSVA